jgi:hypothetical protein
LNIFFVVNIKNLIFPYIRCDRTEWKDYAENKVNVSMMSTGKSYKNVDGTSPIEFSTFFVGTKNQIEIASKELEKIHIADLVDE